MEKVTKLPLKGPKKELKKVRNVSQKYHETVKIGPKTAISVQNNPLCAGKLPHYQFYMQKLSLKSLSPAETVVDAIRQGCLFVVP